MEKKEIKVLKLIKKIIAYKFFKIYKPLDIINKFRKNVGYRISIQKSTLFLHTSNKQLENTIKEHQQHQLLDLTKYSQDLYTEKHKIVERN